MVDPLRSLLHASHLLAPDDLAATVVAHARSMGARETVIYLADYEQATLVPLPGAEVPGRQELTIEATMAGRRFAGPRWSPARPRAAPIGCGCRCSMAWSASAWSS
ncbi:MAG TPA: hypothetical protein VK401_00780 [Propionibacteriaceae bacterium]|nr:hypothetical protein [Propionibacteriaceae bacterium]